MALALKAVFTEVLRQRDEHVRTVAGDVIESTLLEQMREVVTYNQATQGLTSLYTVISAEATDDRYPVHEYFVERYAATTADRECVLAEAQRDGLVPAAFDEFLRGYLLPLF